MRGLLRLRGLGVVPPPTARPLSSSPAVGVSNRDSPAALRSVDAFRPSFPVHKLTELLDHDNHAMRAK